jgi:hypothetical protein
LPLAKKSLDNVDKIVFAREFDIKEWLMPAHVQLCRRDEFLSTEEARKLEVDSVLMISRIREQYRSGGNGTVIGNYYCWSCIGMSYYGNNLQCRHCNTVVSNGVYRNATGTMVGSNAPTDDTALEAELKKWVDNSHAEKRP